MRRPSIPAGSPATSSFGPTEPAPAGRVPAGRGPGWLIDQRRPGPGSVGQIQGRRRRRPRRRNARTPSTRQPISTTVTKTTQIGSSGILRPLGQVAVAGRDLATAARRWGRLALLRPPPTTTAARGATLPRGRRRAFLLPGVGVHSAPGARGHGWVHARAGKAPGAAWGGGAYRYPTCGGTGRGSGPRWPRPPPWFLGLKGVGFVVVPAPSPFQAVPSECLRQHGLWSGRLDRLTSCAVGWRVLLARTGWPVAPDPARASGPCSSRRGRHHQRDYPIPAAAGAAGPCRAGDDRRRAPHPAHPRRLVGRRQARRLLADREGQPAHPAPAARLPRWPGGGPPAPAWSAAAGRVQWLGSAPGGWPWRIGSSTRQLPDPHPHRSLAEAGQGALDGAS